MGLLPVSLGVLRMDSVADMVANIWGVDGIEYSVKDESPVGVTVQIN